MVNRYLAHLRTLTVADLAVIAYREDTAFSVFVARLERPVHAPREEVL